ncbi:hypothetical protein PVBG_05683 [Plasmodium vivax Brazil I]|uniref:Uncharacterized protein n=1 Tax=Plasmodium vivax (strain Brazil I) TaxID=1033975 RepID=A0A0J9T2B8_PLAV1|nr:hypothetical protein PVBG_05683 [Plasmodium vivax Brazil I]
MGEHLTVNDLKYLTSNIIYDNFERGDGNCDKVPFYEDIIYELELQKNLTPIRDKLAKAVCYVYWRKVNHDNFDNDLCEYLYYWVGHKIYSFVSDKTVFSKIIKAFYEELYASDKGAICYRPNYSIDQDLFHKNKLLFEYSKNYKNIYLKTLPGNTTCDDGYINFIKEYINIYKDAYINCTKGDPKIYNCKYLNTLLKQYEHRNLESFHCLNHKAQPLSMDAQGFVEQAEYSSHVPRGSKGNSALVGIPVSRGDNEQYERQFLPHNLTFSEHNELDSTLSHDTNNSTEGGSSKTIAGSVAPVLGVSSFSLLLYKVN